MLCYFFPAVCPCLFVTGHHPSAELTGGNVCLCTISFSTGTVLCSSPPSLGISDWLPASVTAQPRHKHRFPHASPTLVTVMEAPGDFQPCSNIYSSKTVNVLSSPGESCAFRGFFPSFTWEEKARGCVTGLRGEGVTVK